MILDPSSRINMIFQMGVSLRPFLSLLEMRDLS
jgi:hypothetical protein